jgi:DNA (cytosine-5)-methyltransferase 1
MTALRLIDLFAGIGGFSLGLERSGGFRTIKFCEMEPHARAVLAKNFPGIPHHEDVTTYDFREGEADAISAGFPCQDISFAGSGAGLTGSRSGLYREVIRALRVVRPKYAVLENVAALLSRGLDTILWDLAEIGYDAEWHCIPASAVGAPHQRDRIWIIAHARSEQHEGRSLTFSGALAKELLAKDPNAAGERCGEAGQLRYVESPEWAPSICQEMADATGGGWEGPGDVEREGRQAGQPFRSTWWAVEPDVGRVAHGIPARVDRLRGLGNAVVPKIPEIIGRAIMTVADMTKDRRSK